MTRVVDEFDGGLGWIEDEPLARTAHALVVDGKVWLVDPIEPGEKGSRTLSGLGEVAGVIQLLDRHSRDCASLAERFGVVHHTAYAGTAEVPFEVVPLVRRRWWREAALWWPERRVLVCADALGTLPYFRAPGEQVGVYPWLRLTPPEGLRLVEPLHILCGRGEGVHGDDVPALLREALDTSRRRMPGAARSGLGFLLGRLRRR